MIGEALKNNSTLTKLDMKWKEKTINCKLNIIDEQILAGNKIEAEGEANISEALIINTTLTELDLSGERKGRGKNMCQSLTSDYQQFLKVLHCKDQPIFPCCIEEKKKDYYSW